MVETSKKPAPKARIFSSAFGTRTQTVLAIGNVRMIDMTNAPIFVGMLGRKLIQSLANMPKKTRHSHSSMARGGFPVASFVFRTKGIRKRWGAKIRATPRLASKSLAGNGNRPDSERRIHPQMNHPVPALSTPKEAPQFRQSVVAQVESFSFSQRFIAC